MVPARVLWRGHGENGFFRSQSLSSEAYGLPDAYDMGRMFMCHCGGYRRQASSCLCDRDAFDQGVPMAKRALGPHALACVHAVRAALSDAAASGAATSSAGECGPIVVGCSGGPDSLALAAAVAHLGVEARALVIDHGLQPETADVAIRVQEQLEPCGLPVEIRRVFVDATPRGPEADARDARYRVFDEVIAASGDVPAGTLLLAHTLDDQAEQVLLGLARGSGTRSLAGIPPERQLPGGGRILRPLLHLRRVDTLAACREWGLDPWHDPHNDDPAYTRVRVRHDVLPVLEDHLGPGVAEALARTARQARDDADLLDELAERHLGDIPDELPVTVLDAPAAIATRVLRRWLIARGAAEPGHDHVHAVMRLVTHWRGQHSVEVPGLKVGRSRGHLQVMSD